MIQERFGFALHAVAPSLSLSHTHTLFLFYHTPMCNETVNDKPIIVIKKIVEMQWIRGSSLEL
jgi:hypothetical protein